MAGHHKNRKSAAAKAATNTAREDRALQGDSVARDDLVWLRNAWVDVAELAVAEVKSEGQVSIVNAGDQVQKHPAVTVLEAASKRLETIVVLLSDFPVDDEEVEDLPDDAPAVFTPRAV